MHSHTIKLTFNCLENSLVQQLTQCFLFFEEKITSLSTHKAKGTPTCSHLERTGKLGRFLKEEITCGPGHPRPVKGCVTWVCALFSSFVFKHLESFSQLYYIFRSFGHSLSPYHPHPHSNNVKKNI